MNPTLNNLLDEFQKLPLEDKKYLNEIMQKHIIEAKNEQLADRLCVAREHYAREKIKSSTMNELWKVRIK